MIHSLEVPKIERPKDVAWLPQNWTEDQRHRFYHMPQGNELIPYAWFLALEQPRLTITGLRCSKRTLTWKASDLFPIANGQNPDALPVGFTRDDDSRDPYTGQKNAVLGLTCAACHTGELFYGDKAIRIDAGPSLIDLQKFTYSLTIAVTLTYYDPLRFRRFCAPRARTESIRRRCSSLAQALKYFLDTGYAEFKANLLLFPTAGRLRPYRRARPNRKFRFWNGTKQQKELRQATAR